MLRNEIYSSENNIQCCNDGNSSIIELLYHLLFKYINDNLLKKYFIYISVGKLIQWKVIILNISFFSKKYFRSMSINIKLLYFYDSKN